VGALGFLFETMHQFVEKARFSGLFFTQFPVLKSVVQLCLIQEDRDGD
jgi:hypothetical protein